jgi:hypothetical protein
MESDDRRWEEHRPGYEPEDRHADNSSALESRSSSISPPPLTKREKLGLAWYMVRYPLLIAGVGAGAFYGVKELGHYYGWW